MKPVLWVVCGSSSGSGKTHLSEKLVSVLPNAIYAKLGHARVKPGKQPNYFRTVTELASFVEGKTQSHKHIVIESCRAVTAFKQAVVIFLDADAREENRRADAVELSARADIVIGPATTPRDLRDSLVRVFSCDAASRKRIYEALLEQRAWLARPLLEVRTKLWLTNGGLHAFGSGLAELLASVQTHGSLQAAAQVCGMSYRYAWGLLKQAEARLGYQLLTHRVGGQHGGSSEMTPQGSRLLELFAKLQAEVCGFADERFRAMLESAGEPALLVELDHPRGVKT